jgi:hypothetical protein
LVPFLRIIIDTDTAINKVRIVHEGISGIVGLGFIVVVGVGVVVGCWVGWGVP